MSTPFPTIVFCHLQFWRMQLSSSALEEKKKKWFSLALEAETTETTWFSNTRARFYNEHLDKKTQTFQHFEYILEYAHLFYSTLFIFTSQTSWIQKVEQVGKWKNKGGGGGKGKERKKKPNGLLLFISPNYKVKITYLTAYFSVIRQILFQAITGFQEIITANAMYILFCISISTFFI